MMHAICGLRLYFSPFVIGGLLLTAGCADGHIRWIQAGKTTKAEVLERYGEPDLVRTSPEGETASYRPQGSRQALPPVEISVARAGPFGLAIFGTEAIPQGLGAQNIATGKEARPQAELQIRYDTQGRVREVRE